MIHHPIRRKRVFKIAISAGGGVVHLLLARMVRARARPLAHVLSSRPSCRLSEGKRAKVSARLGEKDDDDD